MAVGPFLGDEVVFDEEFVTHVAGNVRSFPDVSVVGPEFECGHRYLEKD
eukprot:CAMPEP_0172501052 /NCGR_PEP_ID=MMETSP1066-20121228/145723_1 /TAXON_ID=671091 /ORGANISM="Coscinodiscus wailesii, Strain CCMP2513" /LENGTH=48 /DNA_ID= /DNA_START= /DNA_END= /DNA_ORIENTATION=